MFLITTETRLRKNKIIKLRKTARSNWLANGNFETIKKNTIKDHQSNSVELSVNQIKFNLIQQQT